MMRHVLVTGGAGFIGSHLVDSLLRDGASVTVLDNFDPFYDRAAKEQNLAAHRQRTTGFRLVEGDLRDLDGLRATLNEPYDAIVHLAAKAGVRPSMRDPLGYQDVNVRGTQNLLEFARERNIARFVFASSSSVYGINPDVPWHEEQSLVRPISPYASTKLSAEFLGHVYSHLYGIRFIALRFFTVYGPRQRPDLAIRKFATLIQSGERIPVFGDGSTRRDYTYINDIIDGIRGALAYDRSMYEVVNLGNCRTVTMLELIHTLEATLGRRAEIEWLPEQAGDVPQTWARVDKAKALFGYDPNTRFDDGVARFVEWLNTEGCAMSTPTVPR